MRPLAELLLTLVTLSAAGPRAFRRNLPWDGVHTRSRAVDTWSLTDCTIRTFVAAGLDDSRPSVVDGTDAAGHSR